MIGAIVIADPPAEFVYLCTSICDKKMFDYGILAPSRKICVFQEFMLFSHNNVRVEGQLKINHTLAFFVGSATRHRVRYLAVTISILPGPLSLTISFLPHRHWVLYLLLLALCH